MIMRRSARTLLLTGLLATGILGLAACSSPLSEEELVARASESLAGGDVAAAELDVKTALQQNPDNAVARSLYGQIYLRQINPAAAIDEFERSLAAGENSDTRLWLAKALVQAGESAELVSEYEAGRFTPIEGNPEFSAVLARAYLSQTEFEAAREALAAADGEGNDYIDITRAVFALQLEKDREAAEALLAAVTERSPDNAHAWSLRGVLANAGGDRAAAETYYQKAAEANPYRLGDRLQLVTTQIRLGKGEAADADLARLEKLIPNYPEVNFLRGQLYFDAGDYENAIDAFGRVLTINPNHPGALLLAASANVRENNLVTAQRQYSQFLAQQPGNLQAALQLGSVYMQLGEPENAEQVARDTLKENEMNVKALGLLAMALSAQGMHADAAQVYEQVASLQPESADALVALGSQELVAGRADAGIERLRAAVALEPANSAARERLIEGLLATKQIDEAAQAAAAYIEQAPESARAAVYQGRVQLQQQDYDGARTAFERALTLEPGNIAASGGMAALAVLNKDLEGAREAFQAALEKNPGDLLTSMNLAVILEQEGDLEAMTRVLNFAVEANPEAAEPRIALARQALANNQPGEAIELLKPVEESSRMDARVQRVLAGAYLAAGQPESAQNSARQLLEIAPEDPGVLGLVARVEMANGRAEKAQAHLEKALAKAPQATELRKMLIETLVAQRQLEAATAEIDKLPEAVQAETPLLVLRGRLAIARGDAAGAKTLFAQAFEQQRNNINLAFLLGSQWALGEREAVITALREWLEEYPADALTRNELASRLLETGDEAGAEAEYETLLGLQPDNVLVLNNLAWLKRKDETDTALEYIRRADELAPDSAQVKDTYAMVEYERGDYRRALALNSKALEDVPGNPDISYNRAQILLASGEREAAIALLRDLVAGPAFASQGEAKALLESLP
jgi:putative PEP-CTERM system TPR-repeat lipoprotein